ncbi:hypothetical protein HYU95_02945 [Candidatus Daviesbacteria bacterium]|nr:hypothetical protein [Candidatus Daviesbacteria bacterium]
MKVLGLVGEKGSGKQTFVNFLKQIASSRTPRNDKSEASVIRQVRFSDILAQTLILWDIPITRSNLQKLSLMMSETFGQTALAKAAKFYFEGDRADIIILDGIRRAAEVRLVRSFPDNTLIYITADQKLRYQRLKTRSEKVGEVGLTFEQFLKEEKSKAEKEIPKISKKADIKLENNGSLEEFKAKIRNLDLMLMQPDS